MDTTAIEMPETQQEHRSPAQYVLIGAILVSLTAMEVTLYYIGESIARGILVTCLVGLACIKFFLVAAYFMHLKDDPKMFRRWFTLGAVAALIMFTVALASLSIQDHRFF